MTRSGDGRPLIVEPTMSHHLERLTAALADRYAIERELGVGGMATVYLAEDLKHHRKVAVKVLRPELAAVLGAKRFLKEIEVTANLQHPHILPLFDSGQAIRSATVSCRSPSLNRVAGETQSGEARVSTPDAVRSNSWPDAGSRLPTIGLERQQTLNDRQRV